MGRYFICRLLYTISHVKGQPGSAGAVSQLTAAYLQGQRHLLDDSILEKSPCASSQNSLHTAGTDSSYLLLFFISLLTLSFPATFQKCNTSGQVKFITTLASRDLMANNTTQYYWAYYTVQRYKVQTWKHN